MSFLPLFTIIILISVIVGAFIGYVRGFKKSTFRIGLIAISAIFAIILAVPLTKMIVNETTLLNFLSMLDGNANELFNELMTALPSLKDLIVTVPAALLAPIVFIFVFLILRLLTLIPYFIVNANVKFLKDGDTPAKRFIGIPIGAVQGLLCSLIIVTVICGYVDIADKVVNIAKNSEVDKDSGIYYLANEADYYVELVKADPIVGALCNNDEDEAEQSRHNNIIFELLSGIRVNDQPSSLTKECVIITEVAMEIVPLVSDGSKDVQSSAQLDALDNSINKLDESKILTNVAAEFIAGASESWSNGEDFLGISFNGIDENIDPIIFALFGTFQNYEAESLKTDLLDVVDIIRTFDKYGVFDPANSDNLLHTLNGDFISELLNKLSGNDKFSVVIPEVTNLGIKLIAQSLNISELPDNVYVESGKCELSQEDITNIAQGFDHVISFVEELENMDDDISLENIGSANISSVGKALDSFKNTSLFENAVDPLAGAIVNSVVGSSSDVTSVLEENNVSYESLISTVQSTANVMSELKNTSSDSQDKTNAVVGLLENITPENADVMMAIVNEDFIVQQGFDEENAAVYADVLKKAMKEMSVLDESEHEAEADKIKDILDICISPDKIVYGEDGVFESAGDLISMGVESKVVSAVIKEITVDEEGNAKVDSLGIASTISDEDKQHIEDEMRKYYDGLSQTESEEELKNIAESLDALSILLGLDY